MIVSLQILRLSFVRLPIVVLGIAILQLANCAAPADSAPTLERPPSLQPATPPSFPGDGETVPLYGLFEIEVENPGVYDNPYDYREIELRAVFSSPAGQQIPFFGFHDGDGLGGQTGSAWKLRFMPDHVGDWTYTYSWTDGSPGGLGSFSVVDSGLPGPLRVASENPWYFETARGESFDLRGYGLHTNVPQGFDGLQYLIDNGYNFTMWGGLKDGVQPPGDFHPSDWHYWEARLDRAKEAGVFVISFGMLRQDHLRDLSVPDLQVYFRYLAARFAPFYNYTGFNPTWEWSEVANEDKMNQVMQLVANSDPFDTLLAAHDTSRDSFVGWADFSLRQRQSRTVFDGNCRACGKHGGTSPVFQNRPIVGAEDIWEDPAGNFGNPRNATEVRRGAWGLMLAGIMPLYSEYNPHLSGGGQGEADVRRMLDFVYSQTNYREYQQANGLVSARQRQVAAGILGQEYLVYDEDGGPIAIDLSGVPPSTLFSAIWFHPTTGTQQRGDVVPGGAMQRLDSPFVQDSVLLLEALPADAAFTLSLARVGDGSVAISPEQPEYSPGQVITLTAVADAGWTFSNWSGDTAGTINPLILPMAGDRVITATFAMAGQGSIQSRVWSDTDGDGESDPEEQGVYDVSILLTEAGSDGLLGTDDDLPYGLRSTDLDGIVRFAELPAGLYQVDLDETSPNLLGMLLTSGVDPAVVLLTQGSQDDQADFGFLASTAAQILLLDARPRPGLVELSWQALFDGHFPPEFHILRWFEGSSWAPLAPDGIPALASGSQVASYSYVDDWAAAGEWNLYQLQADDGEMFGPWRVRVPSDRLYLPMQLVRGAIR